MIASKTPFVTRSIHLCSGKLSPLTMRASLLRCRYDRSLRLHGFPSLSFTEIYFRCAVSEASKLVTTEMDEDIRMQDARRKSYYFDKRVPRGSFQPQDYLELKGVFDILMEQGNYGQACDINLGFRLIERIIKEVKHSEMDTKHKEAANWIFKRSFLSNYLIDSGWKHNMQTGKRVLRPNRILKLLHRCSLLVPDFKFTNNAVNIIMHGLIKRAIHRNQLKSVDVAGECECILFNSRQYAIRTNNKDLAPQVKTYCMVVQVRFTFLKDFDPALEVHLTM